MPEHDRSTRLDCPRLSGRPRCLALVLGAVLTAAGSIAPEAFAEGKATCPDDASLSRLVEGEGVYFGELHGTNEAPAVVMCTVQRALLSHEAVVVSLELQPIAADPSSYAWDGQDGRSSQAMARLVREVEALKASGAAVTIDYHDRFSRREPEQWERSVGQHIGGLAQDAFVVALGGNMHSPRRRREGGTVDPAGSYLSPGIRTVSIWALTDGEAWVCSGGCGVKSVLGEGGTAAELGLGAARGDDGHDLTLRVETLTASPPMRPPAS